MIPQVDVITADTSLESRSSLYEAVAVTSSAAILFGLGFVALYIFNRGIVPSVLVMTSAAGMGLTSGLISRFELPKRSALVRWLVAVFGLCCGMVPMGWLSRGILGFDLINQVGIKPDWDGLLRLALGAVTAWLAVRAWAKRPNPQSSLIPHNRPAGESSPRSSSLQSTTGNVVEAPSRLSQASANHSWLRTPSLGRSGSRRRTVSLGRPRLGSNHSKKPTLKSIRRRGHINTSIHLMDNIEHRCPFCLELVERSDSRGSVECSICHTLHHADCWGVTGTCQVPHHSI